MRAGPPVSTPMRQHRDTPQLWLDFLATCGPFIHRRSSMARKNSRMPGARLRQGSGRRAANRCDRAFDKGEQHLSGNEGELEMKIIDKTMLVCCPIGIGVCLKDRRDPKDGIHMHSQVLCTAILPKHRAKFGVNALMLI